MSDKLAAIAAISTAIAAIGTIFSAIAAFFSFWTSRRVALESVRPVIRLSGFRLEGLGRIAFFTVRRVENIGKGPAYQLAVYVQPVEGGASTTLHPIGF